jgi:dUTP pyrophosphatase
MAFQVSLTHEDATVPKKATSGAAGFDVTSCESVIIPAGDWRAIDTGVALAFPSEYYVRVAPRSGLAVRHGFQVLAGVVDSDFRRPIRVILFNPGKNDVAVNKGDRIAQLVFEKIADVQELEQVPSLEEGDHVGFGSTGV